MGLRHLPSLRDDEDDPDDQERDADAKEGEEQDSDDRQGGANDQQQGARGQLGQTSLPPVVSTNSRIMI